MTALIQLAILAHVALVLWWGWREWKEEKRLFGE